MFLLHVIIIPYESLFLKMRNRHSLLKVLNLYSLAKRNTLCLTKFPKSPAKLNAIPKKKKKVNHKLKLFFFFLVNDIEELHSD